MKKFKLRRAHIISLIEYIMVFVVIFGSNTMLERDQRYNISANMFYLLFSFMCLFLVFLNGTKKMKKADLYRLILVTSIAVLCIVIPQSETSRGFIQWTIPVFSGCFYMMICKDYEAIWKKFVNIMVVIGIISLFFYIGGTVLGIIQPDRVAYFLYDSELKSCNCYYGLYYEPQKTQFLSNIFSRRNCGIFIEAPMFNAPLCLALALELSLNRFNRKWVILVLVVTILSTWSTTGMLFLIAVIGVRLYIGKNTSKKSEWRILIIPIIALSAVFIAVTLVSNKMQSDLGENSVGIRMSHLLAFLKIWTQKPLFGYSYKYLDSFYAYTPYQVGYSVGLVAFLARSGILMFMCYLVPWIKNTYSAIKKVKPTLYYWFGSFIIFFMTAVVYEPVFIFVLCMQLAYTDQKLSQGELIR